MARKTKTILSKQKQRIDQNTKILNEIMDLVFKLKEEFTNSTLPYFVDVVNFNTASKAFKENVFNKKIVWIKP